MTGWRPLSGRRRAPDGADVGDALRNVRDALRSGQSLRQALARAAAADGSPLAPLAPELAGGRPVADVLRDAAAGTPSADLSAAYLVCAVQAQAGGDPAPALRAAEDRLRERLAAEREARSLTTQARMSARAMLLLSPGFLALLAVLDPQSLLEGMRGPGRAALVAGLVLQCVGAWWISRLVRGPAAGPGRLSSLPVLRALAAIVSGGRKRSPVPGEVARSADVCALVLGAGTSPARALELAAPATPGAFGEALRSAVGAIRAGTSRASALSQLTHRFPDPAVRRFADAFAAADRLGVPVADTLRGLGDDLRRAEAAAVAEAVRAASVKVLLPLGLLILPAFVLACLVPLVLGGLGRLTP